MRSQASSNEMRTIIRYNFKKFWTVPALGLFWLLVCGFLPIILSQSDQEYALTSAALNENPGYLIGILILAVCSGMTVFSYLQNPGASNFIHSLPVSRGKLFAANVISGLLMIIGPLIVNCILMSLLAGNGMFLKWLAATFVSCFAIYTVTVFAATISGNTLMHFFNAGFFNCILTLIILTVYDILSVLLVGYAPSDGWITFLLHSNALTAFIGNEVMRALMCGIYLVVGLAALAIGWTIYKKRPIERTGNSVVFPWVRSVLFLICIFSGAILSGLLFGEIMNADGAVTFNYITIIGMVAGALIVYVVGSLMIDRTAKIFTKRNMLPAAIALVLAFGVTGIIGAGMFGYSSYVPDAKDVKAVYLDTTSDVLFTAYDGEGGGNSFRGEGLYYKDTGTKAIEIDGNMVLGMTQKETIDIVRQLHQGLIDQDREKGYNVGSVEFVYELNNGKKIRRSYKLYTNKWEEYEIADYDRSLTDPVKAFYNCKEFKDVYSLHNVRPVFFEKGKVVYWPDIYKDAFYAIPREDVDSLVEALEQDFQESTFEESMKYKGEVDFTIPGETEDEEYNLSIPIIESGKHMKAWVAAHEDLVK